MPSAWGLSPGVKDKAHELADAGFTVLAPDLNDGVVATDAEHAHQLLMEADMNVWALRRPGAASAGAGAAEPPARGEQS